MSETQWLPFEPSFPEGDDASAMLADFARELPRLRKIRDGLDALGLPTDDLLNHGGPRLVYGVELVHNALDRLEAWLGDDAPEHRPHRPDPRRLLLPLKEP